MDRCPGVTTGGPEREGPTRQSETREETPKGSRLNEQDTGMNKRRREETTSDLFIGLGHSRQGYEKLYDDFIWERGVQGSLIVVSYYQTERFHYTKVKLFPFWFEKLGSSLTITLKVRPSNGPVPR